MAASLLGLSNTPFFIVEMFFYALLGGILPALVWMWFWLHESYDHQEPRGVIVFTFVIGMCSVFMIYPFLQYIPKYMFGLTDDSRGTLIIWAGIEELFKFAVAYFCALRLKDAYREPIDAFIYLMTAALGFVAMENTLYLLIPLLEGETIQAVMTGNLRFMGASLLHVLASGTLSVFIAYSFYKPKLIKELYWLVGLVSATALHALFNYFIIITTEETTFVIFSFVWLTTILLILALERVKAIKKF